jgi:transketolase
MAEHKDIHVLLADVGYGMFDAIRDTYPDRFWNVGAAEQAMIGMGVGLALAGKIPICYSITSFLLWRPAELIRNYLHEERVPVVLVGSGRDCDYSDNGPTHWCEDDRQLLGIWTNITGWWPETVNELEYRLPGVLFAYEPTYINLRR